MGGLKGATELASLAIVERVLAEKIPAGSWTPAAALGADFVLELPGTERKIGQASRGRQGLTGLGQDLDFR